MSDAMQRRDGGEVPAKPLCTRIVLAAWWAALYESNPWHQMPVDDVLGEMRRVVANFIRVLRDPAEQAGRDWLIKSAEEHGAFRRAQRCELGHLGFELDVLMLVLEGAVQRERLSPRATTIARSILSNEMRSAQLAAARGWARVLTPRPKGAPRERGT